jgi:hypothetical protein
MFDKNGFSGSLNKFALGLRGEVEKSHFFLLRLLQTSCKDVFLDGLWQWLLQEVARSPSLLSRAYELAAQEVRSPSKLGIFLLAGLSWDYGRFEEPKQNGNLK